MKYTKQLLSRYISGSFDVSSLTHQLTLKSCEVEEAHERVLPELVVIGKVISCEKHPDADKLTVCQVDCGARGIFQICTGATNIRTDIYVPVALPGCFLPAIDLQIEPRKMRGLESNGMICSKEELGIQEDLGLHGIWILQDVAPSESTATDFTDISSTELGKSLVEHAPWLENRMLDVENKTITHRPDMFGHFGLAREINALFSDNIRFSRLQSIAEQIAPKTLQHTLHQAIKTPLAVEVQSAYIGSYNLVELTGVTIQPSSLRQRLQLLDVGLVAKNNWVDFSNYFMYLSGQPIHCFDADAIQGSLVVRQALSEEKFVDLFNNEHTLTEQDIVICDDEGILALAGVVGGKRSGVSVSTTRLLIEIAQFDPVVVRKTAMRLGIRTDAQTRFEKHIAPGYTQANILLLLDELDYLGKKELGNRSLGGIWSWIKETSPRTVSFDQKLINRTLGVDLSEQEMLSILGKLGIHLTGGSTKEVMIPVWRGVDDLHTIADLTEEIARIYGFDAIGHEVYSTPLEAVSFTEEVATLRSAEDMMTGVLGYTQVETYPWIHTRWHDEFGVSPEVCLSMENSMAPELGFLRHTMIPSLLEVIEKNAPVYEKMKIYDVGTVRTKQTEKKEHTMLAAALVATKATHRQDDPFLLIKKDVETLLKSYTSLDSCIWTHSTYNWAHTVQQADIFVGTTMVGTVAHLHPRVIDSIGIDDERTVTIAQIDIMLLASLSSHEPKETTYATLQDQLIWRDVSFVLPRDAYYGHISDALLGVEEIEEVKLIDVYAGNSLADNEKSIALSFLIKGDGSLTTEQINHVMQKAIDAGQSAGGRLR